jgi:hypothetical protein
MKLRNKFAFITGIPILGILIILTIGLLYFNIMQTDISHLNQIQTDYATILNADRDAYQVLESEELAITSMDMAELKVQDLSNQENLTQVWDRMMGPAEDFTEEMQPDLKEFETSYDTWKMDSRNVLTTSLNIFEDEVRKTESSQKAMEAFDIKPEDPHHSRADFFTGAIQINIKNRGKSRL